MSNVAEGPGVDDDRLALGCLHQVGKHSVAQQRHHGAHCALDVGGRHRPAIPGEAHDDAAQAVTQVFQAAAQGQDCHDLGGGDDVETRLSDRGVAGPADARCYLAEGPLLHVGHPAQGDAAGRHAGYLPALDGVVGEGGQQVVCRANGVGVTGEVDVDLILRLHPGQPAAGAAALDAEYGPQGRLPEGCYGIDAQASKSLGQPHCGGSLAFARRGWRDTRSPR